MILAISRKVSLLKSSMHHYSWILFFFSAINFFATSLATVRVSYSDHCGSIVPEALPTTPSRERFSSFLFSTGHVSGGHQLFFQESERQSFHFSPKDIVHTQTSGVLKLEGHIYLRSGILRMAIIVLDLSGFWSEHSGWLCMVGSGSAGMTVGGKSLTPSAVFKLSLPKISNISKSLVAGTIESLDPLDSPNYFNPISLLIYSQIDYEYTLMPQVKDSCHKMGDEEDSQAYDFYHYLCRYYDKVFELDISNSAPFARGRKMILSGIRCSGDGKFRFHIGLSNPTGFAHDEILVAEGFLDRGRNRLCFIGCPVLTLSSSFDDASVGDCKIGFSLWFPTVLSLKSRSSPVGVMWSDHMETDPAYFEKVNFRSTRKDEVPSCSKYNYTVVDTAKELHSKKKKKDRNIRKRMFPDGVSFKGMKFEFSMKNSAGIVASGYAVPLFIGDQFYCDSSDVNSAFKPRHAIVEASQSILNSITSAFKPRLPTVEASHRILNVSYSIRYELLLNSCGEIISKEAKVQKGEIYVKEAEISAEGIYDTETGILYMVGCWSICSPSIFEVHAHDGDSVDCNVQIEIQVPPLDSEYGERFDGIISSGRVNLDPPYFEPVDVSSNGDMNRRAQFEYLEMPPVGVAIPQIGFH